MDPSMPDSPWREHVNFLELTTTYLTTGQAPDEGGDTVEAITRLEAVANRITAFVKSLKSEIPAGARWSGGGYRTKHSSQGYAYSFNEEAILRDIASTLAEQSGLALSMGDALAFAEREGAVKVEWTISGLEKLFHKLDRPLTVEAHEVSSDIESPAHVGKVQKPTRLELVPTEDNE